MHSDSNVYEYYSQLKKEITELERLLKYIYDTLEEEFPVSIKNADIYSDTYADLLIDLLSYSLKSLKKSPELYELIVYNPHSRDSRDLANWWEDNQEKINK